MTKKKIYATLLSILLIALIISFAMSVVVTWFPAVVYPEPIVNVVKISNSTFSFYIRCDLTKQDASSLFSMCDGNHAYPSNCINIITPYVPGIVDCPNQAIASVYTKSIKASINLIALAFSICLVALLACAFSMLCILRRCMKTLQENYNDDDREDFTQLSDEDDNNGIKGGGEF